VGSLSCGVPTLFGIREEACNLSFPDLSNIRA
jgi:hypothetical protein